MSDLDRFRSRPDMPKYPEATDRYVKVVLGIETDKKLLGEDHHASPDDYGGPHVIKPAGNLVPPGELWGLRGTVLSRLAAEGLQPDRSLTSVADRTTWDRTVGATLSEHIEMDPFQAFNTDAWTYLTVHLFPEFPNWRFPGRSSTEDGDRKVKPADRVRGGRRNVLWRVWFRAFVLGPNLCIPEGADPMGEDELDNLFGRPTISRNHLLARGIVEAVYRNRPKRGGGRHFVVREFLKEIRRRYSTVDFTSLGEDLDTELDRLWTLAVPAGERAEREQAEKQKSKKRTGSDRE